MCSPLCYSHCWAGVAGISILSALIGLPDAASFPMMCSLIPTVTPGGNFLQYTSFV